LAKFYWYASKIVLYSQVHDGCCYRFVIFAYRAKERNVCMKVTRWIDESFADGAIAYEKKRYLLDRYGYFLQESNAQQVATRCNLRDGFLISGFAAIGNLFAWITFGFTRESKDNWMTKYRSWILTRPREMFVHRKSWYGVAIVALEKSILPVHYHQRYILHALIFTKFRVR